MTVVVAVKVDEDVTVDVEVIIAAADLVVVVE